MPHYLAFVFPVASGGWGGRVPDLPGCDVEAKELDMALGEVLRRAQQLATQLRADGTRLPPARTLEGLLADPIWRNGFQFDLSEAVTSVIRVPD